MARAILGSRFAETNELAAAEKLVEKEKEAVVLRPVFETSLDQGPEEVAGFVDAIRLRVFDSILKILHERGCLHLDLKWLQV